jgi:exodeoxyribonuclease III
MLWKIATYNVNGIRARLAAVLEWLQDSRPDVLCLQEIKCRTEEFPTDAFQAAGYASHVRGQKGFHGVAILARRPSTKILDSFRDGENDDEARLIAARLDGIWVVNSYVPQGRDPDHPAFQIKLHYFARIRRWLTNHFDPTTPLVWTGDLNVAPGPLDVYDPNGWPGRSVSIPPNTRPWQTPSLGVSPICSASTTLTTSSSPSGTTVCPRASSATSVGASITSW